MNNTRDWLEQQGLGEFENLFAAEHIEFETLPDLTEADLKDLGLPLGSRKKLLKAIKGLEDESSAAEPFPAPPDAEPYPHHDTVEAERRQLTV
ncbi:MAG: hypothetical protein HOI95_15250 [Chromatiales bacterium]|jgi:hypothetical protein|nr:hypothetical protein [Chromatiales bacterium]